MATKQTVLDFIKHNRTIRTGRDLYNKFPNRNLAVQSYIANISNTPENIKIVCYELCKLVGIPERQLNALLTAQVTFKVVKKSVPKGPTTEELLLNFDATTCKNLDKFKVLLNIEIKAPEFSAGIIGTNERKEFLKQRDIEIIPKNNADLDLAIGTLLADDLVIEVEKKKAALIEYKLQELPTEQKESIKLRDQFPFLKEPNCPNVLKLLVADLITAHETFVANQPLLHNNATQADLKKLCGTVVASYIEKKEAFAELEYYGKNLALLGEHPIFEQLKEEENILKMNAADLASEIKNLTGNINRNKKKEKEATLPEQKEMYKVLHENQQRKKDFALAELNKR